MKAASVALMPKPVTITVLEIDGHPMSASVFRQLPKRTLVNRRNLKLNGDVLGRVNYYWGSCNSMHLHVVWVDKQGDLNRDCVYATRARNEPPDHEWTDVYQSLQSVPQLYIEHIDVANEGA